MVLDQTRELVLSWFEGREYNDIRVAVEVLDTKGYNVEEFCAPGEAGGLRRILALVNKNGEGHAVVMDDNESIVDARSKATTKKTLVDYTHSGYAPQRAFVISKKD